ncbi:hypothetical protein [Comamonas sp. lk]|nr:hypothetical protein [Comamonas sp. lk]
MRKPEDRRCMDVASWLWEELRLRWALSDWILVLMMAAMAYVPVSSQ